MNISKIVNGKKEYIETLKSKKIAIESQEKKLNEIEYFYNEKIRKLQNELYSDKKNYRDSQKEYIEKIDTSIVELKKISEEYSVIMKLYEIKDCKVNKDYKVYNVSTKKIYDKIATIVESEYNIINVYIVADKDKKVNKYSLSIFGNSIFDYTIVSNRFDSVNGVYADKNIKIVSNVKNFDTEQKALEYFEKNKKKILDIFKDYIEMEKTLKDVIENAENLKLAYMEYKKNWYETQHGSNYKEQKGYIELCEGLENGI